MYGRNYSLALNGWANLCELNNLITWGPADTAAKVQVNSTSAADTAAGTGAQQVTICGLDVNYKFQTETLSLNGQTQVESTKVFKRVFSAEVSRSGTGFINAGTIYVIKTGTGGTLSGGIPPTLTSGWVLIVPGIGIGTSGVFTVPAGYSAQFERVRLAVVKASAYWGIYMHNAATNTCAAYMTGQITPTGSGGGLDPISPIHYKIPEKTDIYMRGFAFTNVGDMTMLADIRLVTP